MKPSVRNSQAPTAPDSLDAALDHCWSIAARGNNHLSQCARRFPDPRKQRLFAATYAAMRVLDDSVDEQFLALDEAARERSRGPTLERLQVWLAQVERATAGEVDEGPGRFDPIVFRALAAVLPSTTLGMRPWRALATSLERDVRERSLETWEDFEAYGEGACVAPGAVFVYILGCRFDGTADRLLDGIEPFESARDLALFCYCVHILRDLRLDAAHHPQLWTIPESVFRGADTTRDRMRAATLAGDWSLVRPVAAQVAARGADYLARAVPRVRGTQERLDPPYDRVLGELERLYRDTFVEVCATLGLPADLP